MEPGGDKAAAAMPESYEGVGHSLRTVRERKGLTLADVSARIRVRKPHLEAIEHGRFQELPGPVYVTGFLRAYADVLGLDPEHVVSSFQAESDVARQRRVLVFPIPRPEHRTPRLWLIMFALVAAVAAYALWYRYQENFRTGAELVKPLPPRMADLLPNPAPIMAAPRRPEAPAIATTEPAALATAPAAPSPASATAPLPVPASVPGATPSVSQPAAPAGAAAPPVAQTSAAQASSLASSPASSAASSPASGQASAAPAVPSPATAAPAPAASAANPPAAAAVAARPLGGVGPVEIRAEADSWIQVRGTGNEPVFTRLLLAGERYVVPAREGLKLATGNAGGLLILVNGKPVPRLGEPGEVRRGLPLDPEGLQASLRTD